MLLAWLPPAQAETPGGACLTANGDRLYHMRPFGNTPVPPGCRQGDSLVRFQLEQPGTTVRKFRATLTAPEERMIGSFPNIRFWLDYSIGDNGAWCSLDLDEDSEFSVSLKIDPYKDIGVGGSRQPLAEAHDDPNVGGEDNRANVDGGSRREQVFIFSDGRGLKISDVIMVLNFAGVQGCYAAFTARFASDFRSLYQP
jgi:hypothetical protein